MIHRTFCRQVATRLDAEWVKAKKKKFSTVTALRDAVRAAANDDPISLDDMDEIAGMLASDWVRRKPCRKKPAAVHLIRQAGTLEGPDGSKRPAVMETTIKSDGKATHRLVASDAACEVSDSWATVRHSSFEYEREIVTAIGFVFSDALDRLEEGTRGDPRRKVNPR